MNQLYQSINGQSPNPIGTFKRMDDVLQENTGAYTVFRTYPHNKVLYLNLHLQRLRESSAALGIHFDIDDDTLKKTLRSVLTANAGCLYRVGLLTSIAQPDSLFILLEPFTPLPENLYKSGVRVDTVYLERKDPGTKNSEFSLVREKIYQLHPNVHEVIMISNGGRLLEGLSSNFYGIINGELFTANQGVLPGITRTLLLNSAQELLPVNLNAIRIAEIKNIQEAFITSSSRGVLPVVQIDAAKIGMGKPGEQTKAIAQAFNRLLERELQPLD